MYDNNNILTRGKLLYNNHNMILVLFVVPLSVSLYTLYKVALCCIGLKPCCLFINLFIFIICLHTWIYCNKYLIEACDMSEKNCTLYFIVFIIIIIITHFLYNLYDAFNGDFASFQPYCFISLKLFYCMNWSL